MNDLNMFELLKQIQDTSQKQNDSQSNDCSKCIVAENLKSEIKTLKEKLALQFLILDITMTAMDVMGCDGSSLSSPCEHLHERDPKRRDQISMFLDQVRELTKKSLVDGSV